MTKAELYELVIKLERQVHAFKLEEKDRIRQFDIESSLIQLEQIRYLTDQCEQYQARIAKLEAGN